MGWKISSPGDYSVHQCSICEQWWKFLPSASSWLDSYPEEWRKVPKPESAVVDDTDCPLLPTLEEMRQSEELEKERLRWAVETAPNSPHLWQHKYKGTPLQILIEHAKKSV